MANGVQLATAYISLNVRTDDIKKQVTSALGAVGGQGREVGTSIGSNITAGIRSHLGSGTLSTMIFAPMELAGVRWAVRAGKAIGSALKTAIAGAIGGLGIGAIFGAGGILTAGLDRLKTLQQSTVQLSLKLKPEDIKNLQNEIKAAVEGTPISLDKAMQAVPKAISAGMNTGEVKQLITDLANMTASTGGQASFEQLAVIMDQVRSKTKLTGEEMQQLVDAGVDVRGMLKEAFGWNDKTLENNLTRGKVGATQLQQAIQKVYGSVQNADGSKGLAKRMGETFDGAIGNLKASAARLGANFIAAVLGKKADEDPLKDFALGLGNITEALNGMGAWVTAHRDDIHNVFVKAKDGAVGLWNGAKKVWEWLVKAKDIATDVGTKIADGFNKGRDAVGNLWTAASEKFDKIKSKVSEIVNDLKKKFDGIFGPDGWFAQQFEKLGRLVDKVRDVLGLGPATANADPATSAPFNPGPTAMPPLADTPPGFTRSFGTPSGGYNSKGEWVPNPSALNKGPQTVPKASSAAMVPYGLPAGTDTGGYGTGSAKTFPDWVMQIADAFGIKPSTYSGHQQDNRQEAGYAPNPNNLNRGIDWAGPVENLQKFADYLATIPGSMEQVIWQNPNTKRKTGIGGGKDVSGTGYYDDGTYAEHGGNDPNNIHVHTRQSMSIPVPIQGLPKDWISLGGNFVSGGGINGPGSGTSDSIPAMLSNGEHVLTADEVKKMGGQGGVYSFRSALNAGMIPGFAPGGAIGPADPNVITDAQNNLGSLNNAYAVAQAQQLELIQKGDATQSQLLQAQQNVEKSKRALDNAQADLPTIMSGGTAPDRSKQENVYNLTDQLGLLQQQLAEQQDAGGDIPYSQQLQQNYQLESLKKQREQAVGDLTNQGQASNYGGDFVRSLGLIPSAAGSSTVAGTSSLAGFINMGNSVVSGVIDTGTNLAQMAASAAITAGTMGAGAAAGPAASMAASYGIQLAGNEAKRISQYWFGMAGIGADAALEIFSPFGVPRALGYDYAGMTPQIGIQEAALSTIEKMGGDAINKHFAGQGGANVPAVAQPNAPTNTAPSGPAASTPTAPVPLPQTQSLVQPGQPGWVEPPMWLNPDANGAGGGGGGGSWARGGHVGIYDNGGVLKPGQMAFNASRTPESILTKQQWNAMASSAGTKPKDSAPLVQNLYAQDMQDAIRQLEKVKRRDMMQYAGRP